MRVYVRDNLAHTRRDVGDMERGALRHSAGRWPIDIWSKRRQNVAVDKASVHADGDVSTSSLAYGLAPGSM